MHLLPTQSLRARSLAELRPYPTGGPRLPIAVVGGGVAGLTAALQLSRRLPPDRRIILYEAQQRLGGWIESDVVEFEGRQSGAGSVVLEGGPRSIRPKGLSGWTMVELIHSLGLMDRLIIVPSTASSARNRFLSFRGRLNRLPSSLTSALQALFTLPVLRSLFPSIIPALILEPFRPSRFQRPASESKEEVARQRAREHLLDESVESFMRRRLGNEFGGRLTNNILSAVIHGIYACDARSLSVRSALPFLWETEQKHGSLLRALLPANKTDADNAEIKRIKDLIGPQYSKALDSASVYSFKFGVGEITRSIREELLRRPNVELRVGEPVKTIRYDDSGTSIVTSTSASERVSRVVSSLPATALATILDDSYASPTLQALLRYNPSTTVGVVNFAIPAGLARAVAPECLFLNKRAHHVTGDGAFGFLIPRCESQGLEAGGRKEEPTNPEGVLGVVFDSDAVAGQDQADGGVTKLTVMVGGPHFTQPMSAAAKSGGSASAAPLPSEQEILRRAVSALDRHLAIPVSLTTHEETVARARLQRHCIPTYLPGHFSRMLQLHSELQRMDQITVAGASYIGVSLNDVVRSAKATADNIVEAEAQGKLGGVTGLESFVENARG
ncbi:Protoporphyrinogen oxidase [Microstroma glucosiphilum]|uniref:Protoporphyrinogen oxidase n=1 Tax=Pseudomicrostroma glucosiphilum TaxID=1684307 RepID=A0A316U4X6_9BASI|nr:Protoporphyrinogen oxidase [Pseudomicrostroma glucosiphilum]PWN19878.1 Protoporphyrinogen oxidase [Pseudomicrostroma glucosiphilum]